MNFKDTLIDLCSISVVIIFLTSCNSNNTTSFNSIKEALKNKDKATLDSIPNILLKAPNIHTLDLTGNRITHVQENIFDYEKPLIELRLNSNLLINFRYLYSILV